MNHPHLIYESSSGNVCSQGRTSENTRPNEGVPPGLGFGPEFRQENGYRVMTNESIALILNRVASAEIQEDFTQAPAR